MFESITRAVELENIISNSAEENERLLNTYNDEIKPKLKKIISQHSALGCIVGPLPTMGIATTINLLTLYARLGKAINVPVFQELDKFIAPAISSTKSAFIKYGMILAALKIFITGLDLSGVGLPVGILSGVICGYFFSNKAGNFFANNISKFVNDRIEENNSAKS